ncbi:chorismate synthase [Olsenella urininfantis]|uniref:chorismate synthase n=1 Tax=Olsenella urininfantis TaxID=1871033 RepID=UPI000985DA43|nr:chorismate synthase [Olsenella urininfantis]
MPSSFGNALRVSVFGQSHSASIGCVVEGLPSGFKVDQGALAAFMARRAPGQGRWTTPRKESDTPRFLSGLNPAGATCGAPLCISIDNSNQRPQDYEELRRIPRPGHADLGAQAKWGGSQDVAGGGHFSGRLTAPLCAAGGIAAQMLDKRGVRVAAHLLSVGEAQDQPFSALDMDPPSRAELARQMEALAQGGPFPTIGKAAGRQMLEAIEAAHQDLDSVGGVIECVVTGLPAGIGSPIFDGLENLIARACLGIPGVKGIEFGRGFEASRLRGSQNNDAWQVDGGRICPVTNNAGGSLGGISTGAPVLFRLAVKPTPSIARAQQSVDLELMRNCPLEVRGRHDPCIAPRAVPVAEAMAALCALDAWLSFAPEGHPFSLSEERDG